MSANPVYRKQAVRAAVKIHEHLLGTAQHAFWPTLPQTAWEELCRFVKYLRHANRKGWQTAARSLVPDVDYAAGRLLRELELLRSIVNVRASPSAVLSATEIAGELCALTDELESVQLDLKGRSISGITLPLELEGVYLGQFRIVLSWDRIGQARQAYDVISQDPCHPNGRDDITHPHVLDNQLCEGEGAAAIKAALTAGRFYDFFVLVRQVLGTYNPDSAHVSLDDWFGRITCTGCGTSMSEDEYSTCERCDDRYCSDCTWCCQGCSCSICSECSADCAKCDDRFCMHCLTEPDQSSQLLCSKCHTNLEQESAHETNEEVAAPPPESGAVQSLAGPAAAPDSVRLGEASVPARSGRHGSGRVRRQPGRRPATGRRRAARAATVHAGDR
jgi:hypothetical protein